MDERDVDWFDSGSLVPLDGESASMGVKGDRVVLGSIAAVDIRLPWEALLDPAVLANLMRWGEPLGAGASERLQHTTGDGRGPECFRFPLGTASEVMADLGTTG